MNLTPFGYEEKTVQLSPRQQERMIELMQNSNNDAQHGIRLALSVLGYEVNEK